MNEKVHYFIDKILVFTLDELAFALPLQTVVRVIHVVELRRLPKAPEIISGIINVEGEIVPVVDVRKRLGLESKETDPDDRLIIVHMGIRKVALHVDTVNDIKTLAPGLVEDSKVILPFAEHIIGVAKVDDDLILIYDLEKFLSLSEEKELDLALKFKT